MRWRDLAMALAIAAAVEAVVALPRLAFLDGLSLDLLFWLREHAFAPAHAPADSPTVVVALDEETFRTPPFKDLPTVMWTPQLGRVLDAIIGGGAKAVGFDVIFPTSVEPLLPGYDRPFLVALRKAARAGKVVLGKVQHQELPISPFPGQSFAVDNQANIRPVNLFNDPDEVIRRVPLQLLSEDAKAGQRLDNTMPLELAARALGSPPVPLADGRLGLGGYAIPGSSENAMPVNFAGGSDDIPTYTLADLLPCAERGDAGYFARTFGGRVVLVGEVRDVEDRKLTSKRFITAREGPAAGPRCTDRPAPALFRKDFVRDTIPGVYVQATAINNLLRHDALREGGRAASLATAAGLGLVAALVALTLPLGIGVAAGLAGLLAWTVLATFLMRNAMVLPLLPPVLAAVLSFGATIGYRVAIADRDKRHLRRLFGLFLAPEVIDRMVASNQAPALGGETRVLTVWFSDIADFTTLSEGLAPAELVALMNEYLSAATDIVEAHGGFVDKYVGDAITAVFGAPHEDPDHARHAVEAALTCERRLAELNAASPRLKGRRLSQRIGINTGEMLVGNIGSSRRFNYTVMGDAVNLASRLEGVNKVYGTHILVAETTAALTAGSIRYREVDTVRVKGRAGAVTVFEPLGPAGMAPPPATQRYAAALALYRARRPAEAAALLAEDTAVGDDPPSTRLLQRLRSLPEDWEPVTQLDQK